jgi:gamma-glutamyltranspeptidase/glutathione hydrolase
LFVPIVQAKPFSRHAVVAQEGNAADVGRDILRKGGNAIDAAVATAFALAVTLPEAGNIGGGGFIVAYLADRREVVTVDFREKAPLSATPTMYLDDFGHLKSHHREGAGAAAVPGTVRGLALAHQKWGQLPWPELVRPAARLAREGFSISEDLADSLNHQLRSGAKGPDQAVATIHGRLAAFPESVAAFGKPGGGTWKAGDRLLQPDLAATLDRIANEGPHEFYEGKTASLLIDYMKAHGGWISREDLNAYEAKIRPPVKTTFRGCEVFGMGPPSSGGTVIGLMLNILERYDLGADGPASPKTLHRVTEAMRRAYYVRATRLADSDFVEVPVAELISRPFADRMAATINEKATPSASLATFPILSEESDHTTHLSTIDAQGNAVALTYTLEESYGSKAVVTGAGFLLNNEMGDFNLIPGRTDTSGRIGTPANLIAPGKRMLSSQSPTIVLKNGRVRLVTGSPGGRTIPNTTLWVILNVLEFGLSVEEAVAAPRTHHQWFPDVLRVERRFNDESALEALRAMGHRIERAPVQGDANSIAVDLEQHAIRGAADPRRETTKASGD